MTQASVITVTGMKCGGCENNIKDKLQAIDGVSSVTASFKDNQVTVEFDPEKVNLEVIQNTITEAGFTVE